MCDEIINVTDSVSLNVMSTMPINSGDKKVRNKTDSYILHKILLAII